MIAAPLARAEPGGIGHGEAPAVRRLTLKDFRNYARLELDLGPGPVVLVGENGAGKTNLLEAVSLLAPGRGLRRARLSELDREGAGPWRLEARVDGPLGLTDLASAPAEDGERRVGEGRAAAPWAPPARGGAPAEDGERRVVECRGAPLRSQNELADMLSLVWLTPAMDRLFLEGASGRRRFLDRLVLAIDPRHAARASTYERLLRERSHLLRLGRHDAAWLRALERKIAEAGVAIAAARNELVRDLKVALGQVSDVFPRPQLAVLGEVEGWLPGVPALEAEERFASLLAATRAADAETGGAAVGPHRS